MLAQWKGARTETDTTNGRKRGATQGASKRRAGRKARSASRKTKDIRKEDDSATGRQAIIENKATEKKEH